MKYEDSKNVSLEESVSLHRILWTEEKQGFFLKKSINGAKKKKKEKLK